MHVVHQRETERGAFHLLKESVSKLPLNQSLYSSMSVKVSVFFSTGNTTSPVLVLNKYDKVYNREKNNLPSVNLSPVYIYEILKLSNNEKNQIELFLEIRILRIFDKSDASCNVM